jgi:hypothetical protein
MKRKHKKTTAVVDEKTKERDLLFEHYKKQHQAEKK